MKTYAYGFPKLGQHREFKKTIEDFWKGNSSQEKVIQDLSNLQQENIRIYAEKIDSFPDGEMSFYDFMLDTAILCGVYHPKDLKDYYELCRGANALEMTKWFNTNYHYLVPDFNEMTTPSFKLNKENVALMFKKDHFPQIIGPFTFLKLSKGIAKKNFRPFFLALIEVYKKFLMPYKNIQIDEPTLVMDLDKDEIVLIKEGYQTLAQAGCAISLMTYYDSIDFIEEILALPVAAIGLDFVRGKQNFEYIQKNGFPSDKTLIAGIVDGRNIWKNDIGRSVAWLKSISPKVKNLVISNAAPLYHLPFSVSLEDQLLTSVQLMEPIHLENGGRPACRRGRDTDDHSVPLLLRKSVDQRLKNCLSFAKEKLEEIHLIASCLEGKAVPVSPNIGDYGKEKTVQQRLKSLKESDFIKKVSLDDRRKNHDRLLNLPLFPTTTIGSYPQTNEVRLKRAAFTKGELSTVEYKKYIQGEIDQLVRLQETLGLDVFVHGEYERTDMVEFFAQNLDGIATTQSGWIISYGTRVYRPPIIYGDVKRPKPMTVDEIRYTQTKTKKPVKGMLTGAVTIIAWSFCREDIPVSHAAYQIGLALKDEIRDYEKAGIKIVQVDEAAFREKAPIKKREWPVYFDWAVKSFNLTTNTNPQTQIHTHMCYSEFGEIIEYINQMDFDVISIEASRSKGDIIAFFENIDFKRQIGLGVWDIHSSFVPSVEKMTDIVKRSLQKIPKENFWLNPDCGLKTRQWPEVKEALTNMVAASHALRT